MVYRKGYWAGRSAHHGQHMMDLTSSTDNRRWDYDTPVIVAPVHSDPAERPGNKEKCREGDRRSF